MTQSTNNLQSTQRLPLSAVGEGRGEGARTPKYTPTLTALCLALLSACTTLPRDVPTTAPAGSRLERTANLQSRLNTLNSTKKIGPPGLAADSKALTQDKYFWAKAQCWVRNSYSERHENDAAGFPKAGLSEAEKIVQGLEAGNNTYKDTLLVNHTERVRKDLWLRAEKIKSEPGFACAAPTVGCLEVQLSRSGHELAETGWRHGNSYVAIAEDMADKADKEAQDCIPPVPPKPDTPPPPPPLAKPEQTSEKFNLDAGALFYFNKRSPKDLLPKGKAQLDELAERIAKVYASVEKIELVGFTDRLGSKPYNAKLSLDRANTVKAYLLSQGVKAPMTTQGKGPADPVVQCEGKKPTPKLTQCLQPNRRVEITINGVKK
jgi:OmpA-OmpF porin, OOP family